MKKLLLVSLALFMSQMCSAVDLVELKSTDGRTISVLIDNYFPRKDEVAVRLNGQGKLMRFKLERLDEASQGKVKDWYEVYSVVKSLTIRSERVPARERSERIFNIELSSMAEEDIEEVRIDYSIPIKESSMVEEEKNGKKKYVKATEARVITGSIDVGRIPARSTRKVNSDSVVISTDQVLDLGKGKTKDVTNSHSIKGILLKVYVGDQMVREYESQNGVKQLVVKYGGE